MNRVHRKTEQGNNLYLPKSNCTQFKTQQKVHFQFRTEKNDRVKTEMYFRENREKIYSYREERQA